MASQEASRVVHIKWAAQHTLSAAAWHGLRNSHTEGWGCPGISMCEDFASVNKPQSSRTELQIHPPPSLVGGTHRGRGRGGGKRHPPDEGAREGGRGGNRNPNEGAALTTPLGDAAACWSVQDCSGLAAPTCVGPTCSAVDWVLHPAGPPPLSALCPPWWVQACQGGEEAPSSILFPRMPGLQGMSAKCKRFPWCIGRWQCCSGTRLGDSCCAYIRDMQRSCFAGTMCTTSRCANTT